MGVEKADPRARFSTPTLALPLVQGEGAILLHLINSSPTAKSKTQSKDY